MRPSSELDLAFPLPNDARKQVPWCITREGARNYQGEQSEKPTVLSSDVSAALGVNARAAGQNQQAQDHRHRWAHARMWCWQDQHVPKIKGVYREKELMSPRAMAGPKIKAMRHHEMPMAPSGQRASPRC